ncbi:MAG: DUF1937 family protein [Pseudodesulfovibrio sp.]|nr:DUF1937 family protein [Pseudodesulfovibrio sp.]
MPITEPSGSVPYIAGPYRAETPWQTMENIRRARLKALELCRMGYYPFCPHANTALFDGEMSDEFWLEMAMEHLRRCDFVVLVDGWIRSSGTWAEIHEAFRLGKQVYYPDHYIMEREP